MINKEELARKVQIIDGQLHPERYEADLHFKAEAYVDQMHRMILRMDTELDMKKEWDKLESASEKNGVE